MLSFSFLASEWSSSSSITVSPEPRGRMGSWDGYMASITDSLRSSILHHFHISSPTLQFIYLFLQSIPQTMK
ncbi:hypothetical protein L6164_015108 [Bauhinia variegata]|uniref:Uncharacterized protein n=1 Tax=Bauhinia variegata TaxID=167791 RepID=A0ACB9NJQ0_BAUVA|nr:hypothetical protein L6164_015108 [Bauhinia variegata]